MIAVLPLSDGSGDMAYAADGTAVEGFDLQTAVYLSLFWNAPAQADDDVSADALRNGFWADSQNTDGDITGSRLWLLDRAKVTATSIVDAKTYADEALAWLIRDGIARKVVCSSSRLIVSPETQGILLDVVIYRPDGSRFAWAWDALTGEAA